MVEKTVFTKPFTQQEPLPEAAIARAVEIMRSGRLHRYNTMPGEESEAALLERDYARYQGAAYCIAVTSGGFALQTALRAVGVRPGDKVLANAYTLAPVPGAIHNTGAAPVFVETDADYHIDPDDLDAKAARSGARYLMLSHMRGHVADMDRVTAVCRERGIKLIEDCAHTMGARWKGVRSGNFGAVACFSAQTYKHVNGGEGGLITTDDPEAAARSAIMSGSYMLYDRHGAVPDEAAFARARLTTPNYSGRIDNLRAALIRAQLPGLDDRVARWNRLYAVLDETLRGAGPARAGARAARGFCRQLVSVQGGKTRRGRHRRFRRSLRRARRRSQMVRRGGAQGLHQPLRQLALRRGHPRPAAHAARARQDARPPAAAHLRRERRTHDCRDHRGGGSRWCSSRA